MPKRVVVYELNEVPWSLIDLYVTQRPNSALASVLPSAMTVTTVNNDPVDLQPWRTWPTLHRSMYTDDHQSFDLGQDPSTFRGQPLWETAAAAGKRVGVFGQMQSWPAQPLGEGFYVPDTFASTPETIPTALSRFQKFNLAMTAENSFSSEEDLRPQELAGAGLDLLRRGLTPRSTALLARHLLRERRDPRYKASRSMMQVLPSFDLFAALDKRFRPHLSMFFTNHVAGMMHRYWGDGVPGYAEFTNYEPDDVYSRFVMQAMDLFDQQLHRLLRDVQSHPGTVLVIASSMGQGPIEYLDMRQTYVLDAPTRLVDTLGLDRAEVGLAMYPRTSLRFDTADRASEAAAVLGQITTSSGAMFHDIRAIGTTTSFEINYARGRVDDLDRSAYIVTARGRESVPVEQLGIAIRERIGGGNTAYHIPEGIFIAVGDDLPSVRSRPRVDVLDVAPFLLSLLDVQPAPTMQGVADRMRGALMASASS